MHTSLCNARFKLDIMRIDFKKELFDFGRIIQFVCKAELNRKYQRENFL